MSVVTYTRLYALDACEDQLAVFLALFGDSVVVTRELILEHAEKFDWDWAAEHLFPSNHWRYVEDLRRLQIYEDALRKSLSLKAQFEQQLAPIKEAYWVRRKPRDDAYVVQLADNGPSVSAQQNYRDDLRPIDEDFHTQSAAVKKAYESQRQEVVAAYRKKLAPIFADYFLEADHE